MTNNNFTPSLHLYAGAIKLNNIGVSLLEKKAYSQAAVTLREALVVMRGATPKRELSSESPCVPTINVEARVSRALSRLSRPHVLPKSLKVELVEHSWDFQSDSMISSALAGVSTAFNVSKPFLALPIRIQEIDEQSLPSRDSDLEFAVMMYNLAISQLCLSKVPGAAAKSSKRRDDPLKLFMTSYSIISGKDAISMMSAEQIHELSETRILLAILVLHNLTRVHAEMGQKTNAGASYQKLLRLRMAIDEQRQCTVGRCTTAAPAA